MAKETKFGKICKERMLDEVARRFKGHPNFFITSYMGLSAYELELLRRGLKKTSSNYFVVKNSALRIVFDKLKLSIAAPQIEGGVGISLSGQDIISSCKALVNFTKEHDKFKVKCGVFDGKIMPYERVRELASIPSKEILLARVVGGIKSPITGFVNVLAGFLRKFVYVVDAIKTKKGE